MVIYMTSEQRKKDLPKAIIQWYDINKESRIASIVAKKGNSVLIAEALEERGLNVTRLVLDVLEEKGPERELPHAGQITADWNNDEKTAWRADGAYMQNQYNIIVAVGIFEYAKDPAVLLECVRCLLKPDGKLLLAVDNRMGIRYFCGDQDFFTGKNFDSIENYGHLRAWEQKGMEGRAYAKAEIRRYLEKAGFLKNRFFSVFPRIENPQILLAEDYVPNEALDIRIFPEYNNPDTVFLLEEELYHSLLENGLFHGMANGFFIECPLSGECTDINQVTLSGERGIENALVTVIEKNGTVWKRMLYQEGRKKLQALFENNAYLSEHGVRMIEAELREDILVMPYITGIPANEYFKELFRKDKNAFLEKIDIFWDIIQHSSEPAQPEEIDWERFEPGWEKRKKDDPNKDKWKQIAYGTEEERETLGVILKRGYLDLVSLNCFYHEGRFLFYDQELYLENVPAKAIMLRTIEFIYEFNDQQNLILPQRELFERYGMLKYMDLYHKFIGRFLNLLRDDDGLSDYFKEGRREYDTVMENRRRMNYAQEEYPFIFQDIFRQTEGRRLYLFGSGNYARKFLEKYGHLYPASGYLDNDGRRQGTEINGLPVLAPEALREMNPAEYKVIICIKNFMPVINQLHRAGIPNYSVYDPDKTYDVRAGRRFPEEENTLPGQNAGLGAAREAGPGPEKKYGVGYVAGVFDLFHIGHLNLLRRAKEQCGYLIVGVVTDEGVIRHKRSNPKIPYEERIAIVRACRYVDEAVEIPLNKGDTDEAWRRYRFDVQFSGSDYADDPKWKAKRDFLQRHGADLVFFPYTEGISTTQLKDMVERRKSD